MLYPPIFAIPDATAAQSFWNCSSAGLFANPLGTELPPGFEIRTEVLLARVGSANSGTLAAALAGGNVEVAAVHRLAPIGD